MNLTDEFINQYKSLEMEVKKIYKLSDTESAVPFLERSPEFKYLKEELRYCREVRNLLAHNPKLGANYPVEVSEEMVNLLKATMQKIVNPDRADTVMIHSNQVLTKTLSDSVLQTMQEMNEHSYTHIPIVEDGKVIGVFSENTVFSYVVDEEIIEINDKTKFTDIKEYLPVEKHVTETIEFVGRNVLLTSIVNQFNSKLNKRERIGLMIVTNSGKNTEKMLGIITPWDVAAR